MLVILIASGSENCLGSDIGKGKRDLDTDCIWVECWRFGWSLCIISLAFASTYMIPSVHGLWPTTEIAIMIVRPRVISIG